MWLEWKVSIPLWPWEVCVRASLGVLTKFTTSVPYFLANFSVPLMSLLPLGYLVAYSLFFNCKGVFTVSIQTLAQQLFGRKGETCEVVRLSWLIIIFSLSLASRSGNEKHKCPLFWLGLKFSYQFSQMLFSY